MSYLKPAPDVEINPAKLSKHWLNSFEDPSKNLVVSMQSSKPPKVAEKSLSFSHIDNSARPDFMIAPPGIKLANHSPSGSLPLELLGPHMMNWSH